MSKSAETRCTSIFGAPMPHGGDVRLPLQLRLSDLKSLLAWQDGDVDPEMYVRIDESGRAFLYAVKRMHGQNGIGKVVWSREIPLLPGEDD